MPRKREKLNEIFCVPITKTMKQKIAEIAEHDERRPAEMGRILMGEAIEAREEKSPPEAAASAAQ